MEVPDLMPTETWQVLVLLTGAAVAAWLVGVAIGALVGRLARRSPVVADISRRGRTPLRALLVLVAVIAVLDAAPIGGSWHEPVVRLLGLALIGTVGWFVGVAVFAAADLALGRYDVDVVDNRHARRVRTQISLLRRLAVVVISVLSAAAMLLTFPSARAAGASILASAGVISLVAGLAAQTALANVFAGLQLAFTDAMRVDDVVVVEDEWGRIEEITLTYVVVHIWDDRRMVLPSTYFTTTPFENWTRTGSAVLGSVDIDVDWSVPFDDMRAELARLVEGDELWDRRVGVLQVTDAVGSVVRGPRAGQRRERRRAVRPALSRPRVPGRLAAARSQLRTPATATGRCPPEGAGCPRHVRHRPRERRPVHRQQRGAGALPRLRRVALSARRTGPGRVPWPVGPWARPGLVRLPPWPASTP